MAEASQWQANGRHWQMGPWRRDRELTFPSTTNLFLPRPERRRSVGIRAIAIKDKKRVKDEGREREAIVGAVVLGELVR